MLWFEYEAHLSIHLPVCRRRNAFFFSAAMTRAAETPGAAPSGLSGKVEIFVTSWCPYCRKLESFLKSHDIPYTRYDIEADAKGAQIFDKIGGTGVPVSRVGNEVIHGYDPERILEALKA